jgi:energy-coupling factor transporter transmembrane protein EcfT
MSAVPAAILLAAAAVAALLAERTAFLAVLVGVLLAVCLRAPARRRWPYLVGALATGAGIVLLSPLLCSGLRLTAVALAFSAYALLLDHDRLLAAAGFARRSVLAVALATRLVPTLERDAAGLAEAVRGRGLELSGVRGYAGLLSPLVAGSLERATSLAEAMEARGYGRPGATRAPAPGWTWIDHAGLALAAALVVGGAVWL